MICKNYSEHKLSNILKNKLFKTSEGKIFLLGISILLISFIGLLGVYIVDIQTANSLFAMAATNLFVGRVPSLSLGYASGLPHSLVIGTNILVEMLLVLFIYPLFIFSFNNILHVKFLEKFFEDVKVFRKTHQKLFDRYGVFGLFIFVFIPFWMTGPIVGSIIGFLIGIRHYMVISVVFVSTVIAISLWGLFLNRIIDFLNSIDTGFVPLLLVSGFIIFVVYKLKKRF
jgi:uncharacterized membrane protein